VIDEVAGTPAGGRNDALNRAAWTLGRWVAAGALEQAEVEEALYAAAERTGLVGDDDERPTSATIRSGLSAGLRHPMEADADARPAGGRRRRGSRGGPRGTRWLRVSPACGGGCRCWPCSPISGCGARASRHLARARRLVGCRV
jgi:hypothetical protein